MKILYIHQLFKTPQEGGGIRSWYLAKALVDAGHTVEMVTTHNEKQGLEIVDGIRVHYLKISYHNSYGFIKRLWAYGQFVLQARKRARHLDGVDLAYIMTTPLTTGWIGTWVKKKLGIPYYFEVGDLWPDVPVEMGVIKNSTLKNWLFRKEKEFYDQAEKVVAMSPPQVENIQSKTRTPVELLPNMADTEFYQPNYRLTQISDEAPLQILYCGAHGRANHLEFLVEAARNSQHLPIQFTLMGEGSEKNRMIQLADGISNIEFKPHGDKEEVQAAMIEADAIYISFQNLPMLHTGCPNKFFDALAGGKMIVSNLSGWTADLIKENRVGFSYSGSEPRKFVEQVEGFLTAENVKSAQENSRVISSNYSREKSSKEFVQLFSE